jgi:hypothetical protein
MSMSWVKVFCEVHPTQELTVVRRVPARDPRTDCSDVAVQVKPCELCIDDAKLPIKVESARALIDRQEVDTFFNPDGDGDPRDD